jgi:hypothetical protein
MAPTIIKWPVGERMELMKEKFRRMAGFENVVAAGNGTFVNIKAPSEDPESYTG